MNESFKKALKESNKTMYELSTKAGVPYTTVNRLVGNKLDINKISSECLYRISVILKKDMQELLNPVDILAGASAKCGKIKYKWSYTKTGAQISFSDDGQIVNIEMGEGFDKPQNREFFDYFAQMAIEKYKKEKTFKMSLNKLS